MSDDLQSIKNLLFRIGTEVANEAKQKAPFKTGNLKKDIQVFTDNIDNLEISIGNTNLTPYAIFVHQGTGTYGKNKRRITPKNKKALKTPFGLRKSITGQKAQPYLTDALNDYINDGGLNRALDAAGNDISEEVFKDIKNSLDNIEIV